MAGEHKKTDTAHPLAPWRDPGLYPDAEVDDRTRKSQVVRLTALVLLTCVPIYATFFVVTGIGLRGPTLAVIAAGVLVLPVFPLLRRDVNVERLGSWVIAILCGTLLSVGSYTGGAESGSVIWLPAVPMLALLLTNRRAALFWFLVAAGIATYFVALDQLEYSLPTLYGEQFLSVFRGFSLVMLAFVLLSVGLLLESAGSQALETERARSLALAESQNRFRQLVEHAPDGIALHREGKVLYVNPAFATALGYVRPQVLEGRPVLEFMHPGDHEAVKARIKTLLETGVMAPAHEERFIRVDGVVAHFEVVALPLPAEGRQTVLVLARDLTRRKAMDAKVARMERLAAFGMLAAGVGHEINNPLSYVSANIDFAVEALEALRNELDSTDDTIPDVSEALTEARQGASRVRDVVRDLQFFASAGRYDDSANAVALEKILDLALSIASAEIRHRAKLIRQIEPGLQVSANESRLSQVFVNLLINAAHAIPEKRTADQEIGVRAFAAGENIVVEIRDTGAGIATQDVDRIFEPFFTTKPAGQGTGLGLAVCRQIIEGLGGEIEIDSEVGVGTTVRVQLEAAETPKVASPRPDSHKPQTRRGRVLIIDDDLSVARAARRTLQFEHTVTIVGGGVEALETLRKGDGFDVILCDLMMPEMSGIEFFEEVRRTLPEFADRIIFITGGTFTPSGHAFLDSMAESCLSKPFDPVDLRRAIRDRFERVAA